MEHEHTVEAIHDRLVAGRRETYLRDWIFGGIDGTVTTFAAVSGVVGAGLGADVILVIGLANLLADGFSMAASNYLGTKAEWDDSARLEAIEHRHIAAVPEGEREEVISLLMYVEFQMMEDSGAESVKTGAQVATGARSEQAGGCVWGKSPGQGWSDGLTSS